MNYLEEQYKLVKDSRSVILDYISEVQRHDLTNPIGSFNNSSMQSLMTHYVNTYINWIKNFPTNDKYPYFKAEDMKGVDEFRYAFGKVDSIVEEFLKEHSDPFEKITGYITWQKKDHTYTVLELFTHVITHEFHHKGQLMTMSRMLGYTPPDADAIRY